MVLSILYFGSLMHTGIHHISYLPFCSSKFVNKEVENSNEMLIKSVRESKRSPHLHGGFTSQYAPVGWEFDKCIRASKSNGGWTTSQLTLKNTFKVTLSILVKDNVWVVYVH